jgi:hypothetical protein
MTTAGTPRTPAITLQIAVIMDAKNTMTNGYSAVGPVANTLLRDWDSLSHHSGVI